ncbi:MAG TPA: tyrosine-type recombinase/integrase [Acidimicrobiia bacterium]|jgi:integrase
MGRRRTFGTIRKLPSGRYQARYMTADGYRHRAPNTFATKADAALWLAGIEADMARGAWVDPRAGAIRLSDYADGWIKSRPGLRPRTVELYRSLLDRRIIPALGDRELSELRPAIVRSWYASLLRDPDTGSVTVAKCYRLLRAVLNTAVADELIVRNPCTIKGAGIERSAERPVATITQVWALADAVEPRFRALVLTAAFAGLRFGELAALTRGRIDLEARTISVVDNQVELSDGTVFLGPPKSGAGRRTIVIPDALVPELDAHLRAYSESTADARVFTGTKGAPLRRQNWWPKWRAATSAVGLIGFRFHDLRHTCNTLTAATGATTKELMHRMGHSSASAALRYQHATRDRDAVIAQALNDVIERGRGVPRMPA